MSPETQPARKEVQAAVSRLETALGGRDAIVDTLTAAPSTEQLRYVVGLIADPRHAHKSLGELCALGHITPDQLLAAYRSGKAAKAQALAFAAVYDKLPDVAADVMRRAEVHLVQCPTCAGRGTVTRVVRAKGEVRYEKETCETCGGSGEVEKEPDLATQELALTIGGLVPKPGGAHLSVGVAVDARQVAPEASFSQVQKALAKLLQPPTVSVAHDSPDAPAPSVDGEVL